MMEPQDASVSSCEESVSVSQLSQLLIEEDITHKSFDHIALRKQGSQAASHIWRERVTQWCYDVVDHLHGSRSTVYVAMNILDRFFILCPQNTSDRSYEAAALTALFLAVSIRGSRNLAVVDLVRMSRLGVTIREIVDVGKEMTRSLSFDRRLLTPSDFIQELIKNLPSTWEQARVTDVAETAGFYSELCTVDSFFSGMKASEVAFASILTALDSEADAFIDMATSALFARFDATKVSALCKRIKSLRQSTPGLEEPHVIPDSDEVYDFPLSTSNKRFVSRDTLSLRRSDATAELAALDAGSSHQSNQKRDVPPVMVPDAKRRRIV